MTATRWLLAVVLPVVAAGLIMSNSVGYRAFALGVLVVGSVGFWAEGRTRALRAAASADNTDVGDCGADDSPDRR